jgi:hypothetical protein
MSRHMTTLIPILEYLSFNLPPLVNETIVAAIPIELALGTRMLSSCDAHLFFFTDIEPKFAEDFFNERRLKGQSVVRRH